MTSTVAPLGRSAPSRSDALSVVHVTAPGAVGGLESVVVALSVGLAQRGHQIRVVAFLGPEDHSPPFELLPNHGVEVIEIRLPPRSYRVEGARLIETLRRLRPSVVHSHGSHADVIGLRAARAVGVPVVSTVHGFAAGDWKNRLYEWIDRRALRRFDAVVAVSKPLAGGLARAGVARSRINLLPNALPIDNPPLGRDAARRALGLPLDGLVCGWVGRLSQEKGPDVFLRALPQVPMAWSASVVGAGPLADRLRQEAAVLGVADRIRWHGVVPQAGRLLAAFDALVLSSRTEGTPMVVLEAMAARVPLIVTAVGGVPDIVSSQEAILIAPDAPDELAAALASLTAAPGLARDRAELALRRLRMEFSVGRWFDRHEALYRGLSAARR